MGRFLVHMHHGGYDRLLGLMFFYEAKRLLEESADLGFLLALEKLRVGCHQGLHHSNTVLPGAALGLGDLMLGFGPVLPFRLNKMIVEAALAGVHIGITGVLLLGALVVGLNVTDLRPLVLGETEDGILRLLHHRSPRFFHTMS